jgi:hypothetical protein
VPSVVRATFALDVIDGPLDRLADTRRSAICPISE